MFAHCNLILFLQSVKPFGIHLFIAIKYREVSLKSGLGSKSF